MNSGHRAPRSKALLDAIEIKTPVSFAGEVWRVVSEGRDPLQPSGAGGRWDDGHFDALYTSTERNGAIAEAWFHAVRGQPIPPSKPRKLVHRIDVILAKVLDLTSDGELASLGIDMSQYGRLSFVERASEYPTTQQIGEAAFFFEYEAIVVPNARWPAANVVILTENARLADLTAEAGEFVDLMAWRIATKTSR